MSRFKWYLSAVALVVAMLSLPAQAGAEEFPAEQFLGNNFSIVENGWRGTDALMEDLKKDQSSCAAWARDWTKVWSTRQANALADQPHGGSYHKQCVSNVERMMTSNLKGKLTPLGKTKLWKERPNGCKNKKKARGCVFRVVGRNAAGEYTLKKVRLSKHRKVLVVVAKKAFHLKGKLVSTGEIIGVGLNGCTNRLGQVYEKITPIKFKLKLKYVTAGKPKEKGKVPQMPGPALPPLTPPENGGPGTETAPEGTPVGGGPPGNGGQCVNGRDEPIPCT